MSSDDAGGGRAPQDAPPKRASLASFDDVTKDVQVGELDALIEASRARQSISDHETPPADDRQMMDELVAMSRRTGTYVAPSVPPPQASEPMPPAPVPEASRAPGVQAPSTGDVPRGRRWGVVLLAALAVLVPAGAAVALFSKMDAPPPARPTASVAPTSVPARSSAPAPRASSEPPKRRQAVRDLEAARAALGTLRDGLHECVKSTRTLPGSSPAVPPTLAQAKDGYAPSTDDWKTPVWSCARFKLDSPMRFQIQWRLLPPGVEGVGIAWLDTRGTGQADQAIGFRAKVKKKGIVETGEIELLDPADLAPPAR